MIVASLPPDPRLASRLFLVGLLIGVILYELFTGEGMPSRFGGWVGTKERSPGSYWTFVWLKIALLVFLVARIGRDYGWNWVHEMFR